MAESARFSEISEVDRLSRLSRQYRQRVPHAGWSGELGAGIIWRDETVFQQRSRSPNRPSYNHTSSTDIAKSDSTSSTTCAPTANSPQTPSAPALNPHSPPIKIPFSPVLV